MAELGNFYGSQRPAWEKLRAAYGTFQSNRHELDKDDDAAAGLTRIEDRQAGFQNTASSL